VVIPNTVTNYAEFLGAHLTTYLVTIGIAPDYSKKGIFVYPGNFNFTYERDNLLIVLELILPGYSLNEAMEAAEEVSDVIERDQVPEVRMTSYDIEFIFNERVAGCIAVFAIQLLNQRCR